MSNHREAATESDSTQTPFLYPSPTTDSSILPFLAEPPFKGSQPAKRPPGKTTIIRNNAVKAATHRASFSGVELVKLYPGSEGEQAVATGPSPSLKTGGTSRRKYVERRIRLFSASMGIIGAGLMPSFYVVSAYPIIKHWKTVNERALAKIECMGDKCNTAPYSTDLESEDPDYVLDARTRYFIDIEATSDESRGRFPPLDYANTKFLSTFRQPTSYPTLDGETWRLYSTVLDLPANRNVEVVVGYGVKSPSKPIEVPSSLQDEVDRALREAAARIARTVSNVGSVGRPPRNGLSVDGFQIIDRATGEVIEQGPWIPTFLPENIALPRAGLTFYTFEHALYAAETDTNGRLFATSFVKVGDWSWIAYSSMVGFLGIALVAHFLSHRFLRNYFAVTGIRVPSLKESLRSGESQNVEFKRGLSDDENRLTGVEQELLKSIAAFANSNDGVIFVGIDDGGQVRGTGLDFAQRDRMERKVNQLVRTKIRPTPPVRVAFEELKEFTIGRIAVGKGEAPPYMIGGTVYIRHGSSDVQAQPEDIIRLLSDYRF